MQNWIKRIGIVSVSAVLLLICGLADAQAAENESQVERPAVVSAEEWGSAPQAMPEERKHTPAFLTVHHAGTLWAAGSDPVAKLKGLQAFGQNEKGWPDLPYHFLIAPDGLIFEGRPTAYEGETNTSYDVAGHLNIQLWGNFEEQRVSVAQLRSLVAMAAWLSQEFEVPVSTLGGHLDRAETACPGQDLYRYIEDGTISAWVQATLDGQTPDIQLKAPLPDGPTEMIPED